MSTEKEIKDLEKLRSRHLDYLLKMKKMLSGSYNEVALQCGKHNCWCRKDKEYAHISKRITWRDLGTTKMRTVPEEDVSWIKEMTDNYRAFRKTRRKLKKIEIERSKMLDVYEKEVTERTRKLRDYLVPKPTSRRKKRSN